jgi:ribonuclease D
MDIKFLLVDNHQKILRAVDNLDKSTVLSIDTEYDSFRYFKEKLCLIQIHARDITFVFDPLSSVDLSFLGKYFREPRIIKILHAADNDIRLLKRDYSFDFENIFDTHRAALLLGFKQLSLERMIGEFVGVELKKSKKMQRSRWDNRPLTEEQLSYAAQDVTYLSALYEKQLQELKNKNLLPVAQEAFAKIAASSWHEKRLDRHGHSKIEGYHRLNHEQKELLKKLYTWRFRRAKEENRAIFMFLPDKKLIEIAQCKGNIKDFLSPEKSKLYSNELARIVKENSK